MTACNNVKQSNKTCHLGWHITSRCNLACPHCLRRTPSQPSTDLPPEDCAAILESYLDFARNTNRRASIQFSGGNPLLREDFPDLLRTAAAAKREGVVSRMQILGNPETLDEAAIDLLKMCDIDDITISLDGLEATNDRMRGKGNFRAATTAIHNLMAAGVPTSVKYTLVRDNMNEVLDVVKLVMDEGVKHIGIGQLITAGGGYTERERRLDNQEYRAFLLKMLDDLEDLPDAYAEFKRSFVGHNSLYALLFHELGRLDEYKAMRPAPRGHFQSGNSVMFVVWSDGEVVLRREMQRQGYVPRDTFQAIYDASPMLKMLEDKTRLRELAKETQQNLVKCSTCPVAEFCTPGMVGIFGSQPYFAPNRHCWR